MGKSQALNEYVLGAHLQDGPGAGERVGHQGDEGAIAQAGERVRVDRIEQLAGFGGRQDGRLAFPDRMLRSAHRAGRVGGNDLSDHQPVEEHAETGELELDRGHRHPELEFVDVGGDVHRLDVVQMPDTMGVAPVGEAGRHVLGRGAPPERFSPPVPTRSTPETLLPRYD